MKKEIVSALLLGLFVLAPSPLAQTRTIPPLSAFPDLVGRLQKTPGCLGVETARTAGGKQVIVVWFEHKKAVMKDRQFGLFLSGIGHLVLDRPAHTCVSPVR